MEVGMRCEGTLVAFQRKLDGNAGFIKENYHPRSMPMESPENNGRYGRLGPSESL